MVDPYGPPVRASTRDLGPPPAKGLEKLNESLNRTGSLRDPRASSRERTETYDNYLAPVVDPFERPHSARPSGSGVSHAAEKYGLDKGPYDDERESRAGKSFKDDHVETRGFGIRSGSMGRRGSSADSVDMRTSLAPRTRPIPAIYTDGPILPPPFPRDYIPQVQVDDGRREMERREAERRERDRLAEREAERRNSELRERDRHKDRDYERVRGRERDTERDRAYGGEYDREYEREKPKYDSRQQEDSDRHRHSSIVAPAAAAATAAAVYGASTAGSDKRDRDDRHHDERYERDRRHERDEEEPRARAPPRKETLDREPPLRSVDYDRERSRRDPREHDDSDRYRHSSIVVPAAAAAATAAEGHRHMSVAAPSLAHPAATVVDAPPASEKRDRNRGLDREEEETRGWRPSRQDPINREDARAVDYDRERSQRTREYDDSDRHRHSSIAVPAAAAATAGATYGATSGAEKRDRDRGHEMEEEEDRMQRAARQEAPPVSPQDKRDWDRELVRAEEEPRARRKAKQDPNDHEDAIEREFDDRDRQERRKARRDSPEEDPDEDYRRRVQQQQMELARQEVVQEDRPKEFDRERERRYRDQQDEQALVLATSRHNSVFDDNATHESDHSNKDDLRLSRERDNRVRIVEPPKSESPPAAVKSILKQPTSQFPEHPNPVREGVAPLKDPTKKGIPPSARWTKIDRRLVNPQALEELQERFEERQDCVIVLRVLTKEDIQKFADRTAQIRGM
jgi:zinc finger CCCH domain-containing protein 13